MTAVRRVPSTRYPPRIVRSRRPAGGFSPPPIPLGFIAPSTTAYALTLQGSVTLRFIAPRTIVVRPVLQRPVTVTAAPQIEGVPASGDLPVGTALTCTEGVWTGPPVSIAFQWQRETGVGAGLYANIAGAASRHYIVRDADVDLTLRCVVTAT